MKILVVCQYYYPEPFRIKDICEEMVRRGHEVHVVTGYPNYPEGILYEGYGKGKHIDEVLMVLVFIGVLQFQDRQEH